jgi:hypothetical protein
LTGGDDLWLIGDLKSVGGSLDEAKDVAHSTGLVVGQAAVLSEDLLHHETVDTIVEGQAIDNVMIVVTKAVVAAAVDTFTVLHHDDEAGQHQKTKVEIHIHPAVCEGSWRS